MREKQVWLDNARAITTIAVIFLHVAAPLLYEYGKVSNELWWVGNVYDSAVRFCVPIFFMITGALLLSKDSTLSDFLRKRFLRIIPPLVFWSLVYIVYNTFIVDKKSVTLLEFGGKIIKGLFQRSEYHLWFIYVLLGLYLCIPILRKWIKNASNKEIHYFILIWGITLLYRIPGISDYLPEITLVNFSGFIGYLVLGYYLANKTVRSNYIPVILVVIGTLITIFGTYYLSYQEQEFCEYLYGYLTPNVLMSSIGVFLLFKKWSIKNKIAIKTITFLSSHSFGIYLSHILVLSILERQGLDWSWIHPAFSIPLLTIVSLLVSGGIVYLLKKNKYGRYVSG
ncbi:acyltransferase [Aquimarina aquimarini]|uniref:acyltransferase n=1 Tax=Aquimarina aquimarini TaxID=1191734 RepID=UPI00131F0799|nr:acyltransferase family protein [Aquimarina aquimarini]